MSDRLATREPAVATVLGAVLAALAWLRLDPTTRGTLWAEDGVIFRQERQTLGPWESLLHVYAGYLHVVPRLLADVAVLVPVEQYAVTVTLLCCVVQGAVGALVFLCTRGVVRFLPARVALASITVLVPAGVIETAGNLANLHWYALWLAPWLLLARPTRWRWAVALGFVGLLAALTEIQVAMFLPLLLFRLRDRRSWPVAAGLVIGVGAQVAATLTHPRPRPDADVGGVVDLLKGLLLNVVVPIWRPSANGAGEIFTTGGWRLTLVVAAPFVAVGLALTVMTVSALVRREPGSSGRLALLGALVVGSVVPLVAGLVLNPSTQLLYDSFSVHELAGRRPLRYGVVPTMFVLALVLVWADALVRRRGRTRAKVVTAGVAVACVVIVQVAGFDIDRTRRSDGPSWSRGVAAAQAACRAGEAPPPVPAAPVEGWAVPLGCDVLLEP
jgi:hypothetical protein